MVAISRQGFLCWSKNLANAYEFGHEKPEELWRFDGQTLRMPESIKKQEALAKALNLRFNAWYTTRYKRDKARLTY